MGSFVFAVVFLPVVMLWFALTASILYGWFMVPFFGLPALSIWQSWAVMMTIQAFVPKLDLRRDTRDFNWGGFAASLIGRPILALAFGAIIKFWILA